jgi:peptidyl-tRNA hydrolase
MSRLKQILIIRTDLKMRQGKEISQGAHTSMKMRKKSA